MFVSRSLIDLEKSTSQALFCANASLDLQDALLALPDSDRGPGAEAAAQLVKALLKALAFSPDVAVSAMAGVFSRLLSRPEYDVAQRMALFVLEEGVWACCGDDDSRALMERLAAFLENVESPESNTLKIREIAREVEIAVSALNGSDPAHDIYDMPGRLLDFLKSRFDRGIEQRINRTELADWLGRYARSKAKGKLTLAGIVANIIRQGRIAGAQSSHPPSEVVKRVDNALK